MRLNNLLVCLLLFALLPLCGCGESDADSQAVRDVFDQYFEAVQQRDGDSAVTHVSASTIDYYQSLVDMSLDYDEQQTKALPLLDKVSVVMARHRIEPDVLRQMTGRDLFAHGVTNGWVGDDGMQRIASGSVELEFEVSGQEAWMSIFDPQTNSAAKNLMRFEQDAGTWKMDVVSLLKKAQPEMRRAVMDTGMNENQFVEFVAGMDSDRPVQPAVWEAVGR